MWSGKTQRLDFDVKDHSKRRSERKILSTIVT